MLHRWSAATALGASVVVVVLAAVSCGDDADPDPAGGSSPTGGSGGTTAGGGGIGGIVAGGGGSGGTTAGGGGVGGTMAGGGGAGAGCDPADCPQGTDCQVAACDENDHCLLTEEAAETPCTGAGGGAVAGYCDNIGQCSWACLTDAPAQDPDCASQFCQNHQCSPPSCNDGVVNGDETDVDCGGSCGADCGEGQGCSERDDCTGRFCDTGGAGGAGGGNATGICAECSSQSDCEATHFCDTTNYILAAHTYCQPRIGNTSNCEFDDQCYVPAGEVNGFCEDVDSGTGLGICCDADCGAECASCRASLTFLPNGTCAPVAWGQLECRSAVDDCDSAEHCDGVGTVCPLDASQPDGTGCDDGVFCNGSDTCASGSCSTHPGDPCSAPQACWEGGGLCADVWINEIHYDNADADVGEGVELAGPAGLDLTGWTIEYYNGSNGDLYMSDDLSGVVIDDEGSGYGALWFPHAGLQNGAPDGVALIDPSGVVVQFLSYEGAFTADADAGGVAGAAGAVSDDIGVGEDSATDPTHSLQLAGTGHAYVDFAWAAGAVETKGSQNTGQFVQ